MDLVYHKLNALCQKLYELSEIFAGDISDISFVPCEYKTDNTVPGEGWKPFERFQRVMGRDCHFWFRLRFRTPKPRPNSTLRLVLSTGRENQWDATNPQGMVYENGKFIHGLDINHREVLLECDRAYELYIYFYVGMISQPVDFIPQLFFRDECITKTYYDLLIPLQSYEMLDPICGERAVISRALEAAANLLVMWPEYSEEFYASMARTSAYMLHEFYEKECGKDNPVVHCMGHTHIDVAWQWQYRQTREKAQRSFSNVLELMRRYPEHQFMSSQPQLYQYIKEAEPEMYKEIQQRVKEGRWQVEGAMWVEPDMNLISGESMIRQILHGKNFFKEEFDYDSKILWLPDVFGYSAALPQVLKKCGIDDFVTAKLCWNEYNRMPNDSFLWQGIDGTEIMTNFLTAQDYHYDQPAACYTTYVGDITPKMVKGAWKRYEPKDFNQTTCDTYGFGDGGGGPTREMLESQRRLAYGIPGVPRTVMSGPCDWLKDVNTNFRTSAKLLGRTPRWVGELYMEMHRGTYTSIAKNKRNNRKAEYLLQGTEGVQSILKMLLNLVPAHDAMYQLWETVLLQQFHDVLPGSSIYEVYEETDRIYADVFRKTQAILDGCLDALAQNVLSDGGVLVYNPLGFARKARIATANGLCETEEIPAMGWRVVQPAPVNKIKADGLTLDNGEYVMTLDAAGRIAKLYDRRYERDVLAEGAFGNELQVFEDYPKNYDAWEITKYYKQKMERLDSPADITAITDGCRTGFRVVRNYLSSTISQNIWMYDGARRIDFETELDWHEEHKLLKVAFPTDIHATEGTYEIQLGHLRRPSHENTSWDEAKFEVCAHKWADISEAGYGFSLMNDCKYGHNAESGTLKLSLLKCATDPNPQADKGHHVFTYAIFPHGTFDAREITKEAYSLNVPAMVRKVEKQEGVLPEAYSLVSASAENVIIDTVKPAEDGKGIIVRLYDCANGKCRTKVTFGFPVQHVYLCDMLEHNETELPIAENAVSLPVRNFEIVTLRAEG